MTQAQIDAAAQAIIRCSGSPPPTDKIARYVAEAALTAATQVGDCKTCGGRGYVVYDAEWEPYAVQCPDCKAAQVGEPKDDYWVYSIDDLNATIERCAQVVDDFGKNADGGWTNRILQDCSAAIRKLKDTRKWTGTRIKS